MFEIYSYMFTSGLFSAHELSTYIGYGLTEAQYQKIVGEDYVAPQTQPAQAQPTTQSAAPTQTTTTADEGNNK